MSANIITGYCEGCKDDYGLDIVKIGNQALCISCRTNGVPNQCITSELPPASIPDFSFT